jgi:hypothetical protein
MSSRFSTSSDPEVISLHYSYKPLLCSWCPLNLLYNLSLTFSQLATVLGPDDSQYTTSSDSNILNSLYHLTLIPSQFPVLFDPDILSTRYSPCPWWFSVHYTLWLWRPLTLLGVFILMSSLYAASFVSHLYMCRDEGQKHGLMFHCFTAIWFFKYHELQERMLLYTEAIHNCINQKAWLGLRINSLCKGTQYKCCKHCHRVLSKLIPLSLFQQQFQDYGTCTSTISLKGR